MDALYFINNWANNVEEIENVVKEELYPVIREMYMEDPHDWVQPESCFLSQNDLKGMVWRIFLSKVRKFEKEKVTET